MESYEHPSVLEPVLNNNLKIKTRAPIFVVCFYFLDLTKLAI